MEERQRETVTMSWVGTTVSITKYRDKYVKEKKALKGGEGESEVKGSQGRITVPSSRRGRVDGRTDHNFTEHKPRIVNVQGKRICGRKR
jgi:hypothetical protein